MQGIPPLTAHDHPRWRRVLTAPLTIAMAVGVVFGVLEPVPADMLLRQIQSRLMPVAASGEIVLIRPDAAGGADVDSDAAARRVNDARLIAALRSYNVERVFFEETFSTPTTPAADQAFAEELERLPVPAVLATKVIASGNAKTVRKPLRLFAHYTAVGNSSLWSDPLGYSEQATYNWKEGSSLTPTFSSMLAGKQAVDENWYLVDFRIQPSSVPEYTRLQVARGILKPSQLSGRTILVADNTDPVQLRVPVYGLIDQAIIHILAAETLLRGEPVSMGWLPLLGAFLLAQGVLLLSRTRKRGARWWITAAILTLAASMTARLWLINLDVTPTLAAIATIAWTVSWRGRKARAEQTNPRSGLPNMTGFRAVTPPLGAAIVVARVARHEETMTAVPPELHGEFARAIVRRLNAGDDHRPVYHDENGHFAWHERALTLEEVESHLSGLKALFASPVDIDGRKIDIELAFGVDLNEERSPALRLSSASEAAAEAAASGHLTHSVGAEKLEQAEWRASLHSAIDAALANQEIWVAYQAKLDLRAGAVTGAEALVRWTHPTRGNIPPDQFIEHAERDGRIDSLTWAVLDHAVSSAAMIVGDDGAFNMAVNLSAVMLSRHTLHEGVMECLARHRLDPAHLTLELTETVPLGEDRVVMDNLTRLRASGIRISIDDYGTGASNLLYLRHVPSDEVKIDRAFIIDLPASPENAAIVRGTIDMVHALGRQVVAEGVEDLATLRLLGEFGCDLAQGFAIARPVHIADFREQFHRNARTRYVAVAGN